MGCKYEGGTFKVPFLNRWIVVISKEELIEEIKKAPDDKISITDALVDVSITTIRCICSAERCLVYGRPLDHRYQYCYQTLPS